MPNGRRAGALVTRLIVILLVTESARSQAEEFKSYPVLSGVGIALRREGERLLVGAVLPDSPADECEEIHEGDMLASVDADGKQTTLKDKTVGEAASLIRGPVGTEVTLMIVRAADDSRISVTLKRAALELQGVAAATYESFVGKPVADLKLSSFDGASTERLSDHRGKVVVVDFWASWCATCYQPVAKLQKIAGEHPEWADEVELITVTVDADLSRAADTVRKQKWNKTRNLAVSLDELKAVGVSVVPVAIIISKDGTVASMAGSHALDFKKEIATQLAH
ncbi:MAG TPA: thioredoxin-like domain-containing protein [Pirellulales bacterium]|nr:thioredoxin-like domain-containing protein [Pirellulales bacterium]